MDDKYCLPWELAARLALIGFNEQCRRRWGRDAKHRILLPINSFQERTIPEWNIKRFPDRDCLKELREIRDSHSLNSAWIGYNVAGPTYDEIREWFTEKYEIHFIQEPKMGSVVKYLCNPILKGKIISLPACNSYHEAQYQAFDHLVKIVKPINLYDELIKEEKLNQINYEEVDDQL